MPSATVVSSAFVTHAHLAAKNVQLAELPLLVTPHPLNDLTPGEMRELARSAYRVVIRQLTWQAPLDRDTKIDFIHPANARTRQDANSRTGLAAGREAQ